MTQLVTRLIQEEEGQDLIEYVLIGSVVSIGALLGAQALGTGLNGWYNKVSQWVTAQTGKVP